MRARSSFLVARAPTPAPAPDSAPAVAVSSAEAALRAKLAELNLSQVEAGP